MKRIIIILMLVALSSFLAFGQTKGEKSERIDKVLTGIAEVRAQCYFIFTVEILSRNPFSILFNDHSHYAYDYKYINFIGHNHF